MQGRLGSWFIATIDVYTCIVRFKNFCRGAVLTEQLWIDAAIELYGGLLWAVIAQ